MSIKDSMKKIAQKNFITLRRPSWGGQKIAYVYFYCVMVDVTSELSNKTRYLNSFFSR